MATKRIIDLDLTVDIFRNSVTIGEDLVNSLPRQINFGQLNDEAKSNTVNVEQIDVSTDAAQSISVNAGTKFHFRNTSNEIKNIFEPAQRTFVIGVDAGFPVADDEYFLYCNGNQNNAQNYLDTGSYTASLSVPTYSKIRGGFYATAGKALARYTVAGGNITALTVYSGIFIYSNVEPATTGQLPGFVGQYYIDVSTDTVYFAKGIAAVTDWFEVSGKVFVEADTPVNTATTPDAPGNIYIDQTNERIYIALDNTAPTDFVPVSQEPRVQLAFDSSAADFTGQIQVDTFNEVAYVAMSTAGGINSWRQIDNNILEGGSDPNGVIDSDFAGQIFIQGTGPTEPDIVYIATGKGVNDRWELVTNEQSWTQGGNAFGATGVIGTTDSEDLSIIANNTEAIGVDWNNSNAIRFNNAYTFPTADGDPGFVLATDGAGNVSFQPGGGSGFVPTLQQSYEQSFIPQFTINDINGALIVQNEPGRDELLPVFSTSSETGELRFGVRGDGKVFLANTTPTTDPLVSQLNIGSTGSTFISLYRESATINQRGWTHTLTTSGAYRLRTFNDLGSNGDYALEILRGNNTVNEIRLRTGNNNRLRVLSDGKVRLNNAYSFPLSDGGQNQVLTTDGAGNIEFRNINSLTGNIGLAAWGKPTVVSPSGTSSVSIPNNSDFAGVQLMQIVIETRPMNICNIRYSDTSGYTQSQWWTTITGTRGDTGTPENVGLAGSVVATINGNTEMTQAIVYVTNNTQELSIVSTEQTSYSARFRSGQRTLGVKKTGAKQTDLRNSRIFTSNGTTFPAGTKISFIPFQENGVIGSTTAWVQGGNNFGGTGDFGLTNAQRLNIRTNNVIRIGIETNGQIQFYNNTYRFPTNNGVSGSVLLNDGSGNLSWQDVDPNAWLRDGNALTGTEKLGSTNAQPLSIITNNQEKIEVSSGSAVTLKDIAGNSYAAFNNSAGGKLDIGGVADISGLPTHNLALYGNTDSIIFMGRNIGGLDEKLWGFRFDDNVREFKFSTYTDFPLVGVGETPLRIRRSGAAISEIELSTTGLDSRIQLNVNDLQVGQDIGGFKLPLIDGDPNQVLTTDGAGVVVWADPPGAGGGEANDGVNLGAGEGVFATKVGVDLQFKSLVAGTGLAISSDANEITFDASGLGTGDINQGGNIFGEDIVIGTDDNFGLVLKTNNTTAFAISNSQAISIPNLGGVNQSLVSVLPTDQIVNSGLEVNNVLVQGGNVLSQTYSIGANDNFGLELKTNALVRLQISNTGEIRFNDEYSFPTATGNPGDVLVVDGTGDLDFVPAQSIGEINDGNNLGNGSEVFRDKSGPVLNFRSFVPGNSGNVTVTQNPDEIEIEVPFVGEETKAVNLPGGSGLFFQKNVLDELEFKSLIEGTNITFDVTDDNITINTSGIGEANTASNLPGDEGIFFDKDGIDLRFKSLSAGSNVILSSTNDSITINSVSPPDDYTNAGNSFGQDSLLGLLDNFNLDIITNGVSRILVADSGEITIGDLAGTGNRIVAASATGELNDPGIEVGEVATNGVNLGVGEPVFKQADGANNFEFRSLLSGPNIAINNLGDELQISATGITNAFIQDGNIFGETAVIGTLDNFGLDVIVNGTPSLQINTAGELFFLPLAGVGNRVTYVSGAGQIQEVDTDPFELVTAGDNLGTGEGVFAQKTDETLDFKSLVAGTNITFDATANDITINAIDTGEANTASNLPGDEGIFFQKTGVDLELKSLTAGTGITLVSDNDQITISSTASATVSLQDAYDDSVQPQITTDNTLGSVQFQRGSFSDSDIVFEVLNGAGVTQFNVTGTGQIQSDDLATGIGTQIVTTGATGILGWDDLNNLGAFIQDGNDFGLEAVFGTTDNFGISFITNNLERMTLDNAGVFAIGTGATNYTFPTTRGVTGDILKLNATGNLEFVTDPAAGEANTASNRLADTGTTKGIFFQKTSVDLEFKNITAGTNITLSDDNDQITISAAGGVGEANTSSNQGGGVELALPKSVIDLPFRTLTDTGRITITQNVDTVDITTDAELNTASNLPGDEGIFANKNVEDLEFKSLTAGNNITLSSDANAITINSVTASDVFVDGGNSFGSSADLGTLDTFDLRFITDGANRMTLSSTGTLTLSDLSGGGNGLIFTNSTGLFLKSTLDPAAVITDGTNLGGGDGVFAQANGNNLEFKSLVGGTGITLSATATEITIDADPVADNTFQEVYDASGTQPQIITSAANGEIVIQQGTGDDTDAQLEVRDGLGNAQTRINAAGSIATTDGYQVANGIGSVVGGLRHIGADLILASDVTGLLLIQSNDNNISINAGGIGNEIIFQLNSVKVGQFAGPGTFRLETLFGTGNRLAYADANGDIFDTDYTIQTTDGNAGEVLTTDGLGNATWQPAGGSANAWELGGNTLTQIEELGSANAFGVSLITNNVERAAIASTGEITFGTGGTNYEFPTARGTDGQGLVIDGSGVMTFQDLASGNVAGAANFNTTPLATIDQQHPIANDGHYMIIKVGLGDFELNNFTIYGRQQTAGTAPVEIGIYDYSNNGTINLLTSASASVSFGALNEEGSATLTLGSPYIMTQGTFYYIGIATNSNNLAFFSKSGGLASSNTATFQTPGTGGSLPASITFGQRNNSGRCLYVDLT